jgi:hypothetical protein
MCGAACCVVVFGGINITERVAWLLACLCMEVEFKWARLAKWEEGAVCVCV